MKLLLSGYYGFGNTGDEAICEAIVAETRSRITEAEVTVLSANPQLTSAALNVRAADRWKLTEQISELRRADVFIQGGGGLYQDTTSRLSALYYLNQLVMARMMRTPTMVFAQGIGPLHNAFLKGGLIRNLSRASLVTVRDQTSADDLIAWGLQAPPPAVTADPAMLLAPAPRQHIENLLASMHLTVGEYITVALRNWPGAEIALSPIADWLNGQKLPVLLLPFHHEYDYEIALTLHQMLAPGSSRIPPIPMVPADIMGIIKAADSVLAMRLHALIMACAVETPAAGIAYDPKLNAFCERSGQVLIGLRSIQSGAVAELMQQARNVMPEVQANRRILTAEAARNFDLLCGLCANICPQP